MIRDWTGLVLLDKPSGPTSHDLVSALRRATGQRRIGHAGTLDPLASGLLPLVLGPATRLVRFLPKSPKLYEGCLRLGLATDSDDITGEVLDRHQGTLPSATEVMATASEFVGRQMQTPPSISARKVGGERLYKLSRRGIQVDAPASEVEVFSLSLESVGESGDYRFSTSVTGGTYVRSIVRDLGRRLGCGGVLTELRRLQIGPISVRHGIAPDDLGNLDPEKVWAGLTAPGKMPLEPPPVVLADPGDCEQFGLGMAVPSPSTNLKEGYCRVLGPGEILLGIAEYRDERICPRVVLPAARKEG